MKLKNLEQYSKRELLELIISNQVITEQRIFKIYSFLSQKHGEEFTQNNQHKIDVFKEFLDSYNNLDAQIRQAISEQKD